ncbi:MAG: hypothetical protein WCU88_05450 [Elusimicrobiota bacterium]
MNTSAWKGTLFLSLLLLNSAAMAQSGLDSESSAVYAGSGWGTSKEDALSTAQGDALIKCYLADNDACTVESSLATSDTNYNGQAVVRGVGTAKRPSYPGKSSTNSRTDVLKEAESEALIKCDLSGGDSCKILHSYYKWSFGTYTGHAVARAANAAGRASYPGNSRSNTYDYAADEAEGSALIYCYLGGEESCKVLHSYSTWSFGTYTGYASARGTGAVGKAGYPGTESSNSNSDALAQAGDAAVLKCSQAGNTDCAVKHAYTTWSFGTYTGYAAAQGK